jgi:hypothetical protein
MVENKFDATNFDLFDVEELEGRFEMRAWIRIYEPCDCDGDGCDDHYPLPNCGVPDEETEIEN